MKITKKIISVLLALVLTLGLAIPALAMTGSSESAGEPGKTVDVPFEFATLYSIDGSYTVDDPDGIVEKITYDVTAPAMTGKVQDQKFFYFHASAGALQSFKMVLHVQLKNDPTLAGKECTITFNYKYSADGLGSGGTPATYSVTIKMELNLDYNELDNQIAIANGKNEFDYDETTWANMQAELAAANALKGNALYQAVIDAAALALKNAILALDPLDYTQLNNLIATCDQLSEFDYILESWTPFAAALTEAKAFVGTARTQLAIDQMYQKLYLAMLGLEEPSDSFDYSVLKGYLVYISQLESEDYTADSWANLMEVKDRARRLIGKAENQPEITRMVHALSSALDSLKEKLDFTGLQAAINNANALNPEDYTELSWAQLQKAVSDAMKLLTAADVTKAQIDDAVANLKAATNALVTVVDLNDIADLVAGLNPEDYTTPSWNALQAVLAKIDGVKENGTAAQIAKLYADIEKAIASLIDISTLRETILKGEATEDIGYTDASWNALQTAIAAGKTLLDNCTQAQADSAAIAIQAAIDALVKPTEIIVPVVINYVELKAAILAAKNVSGDGYTASSWNAFQAAISAADALVDKAGSQDQVDLALEALIKAQAALVTIVEEPVLDYTELTDAIGSVGTLVATDYTAESWAKLMKALGAAEAINGKAASKAQIDAAITALNAAKAALVDAPVVPEVKYEALIDAIASVKGLVDTDYTADTWANLMKALGAAEAINGKAASQDVVDAAVKALNDAKAALVDAPVVPEVKYEALNDAIASVKGLVDTDYTADTWANLMKALGAAEAINGKAASQDVVDAAVKVLNDAKAALVDAPAPIVPNYKELGKVIGEVRALKAADYTADTWANLMKALGAAEAINNMAATQDEIDAACKALKDAKAALKNQPTAPVLNYSALQSEINAAKALKAADYTADTWANLMKALGAAEAINGKATTQDQIDSAKNAVAAAVKALKAAPAAPQLNYGKLTEAIADGKKLNSNDYTADAWASIQSILNAAEAINGKAATQAQIDALVDAYNNAKKAVIKPVEIVYTQLTDKFAAADLLNEADYTADTWATLKELLNKYRGLVGNAETQSQVDVAAYALQTAIESLVKVTPSADTVELDAQLQAAQGLVKGQYTPGSWDVLQKALTVAQEAKASNDQAAINAAAAELKSAIEALVKVDYTALQAAIDAVGTHAGDKNVSQLWNALHGFLEGAKDLMENGADQATIDALVTKINDQLALIKQEVEKLEEEEIKYVDKIVNVPTDPTDPFCNKSGHTVNTILMWVGMAINLAAIAVVITYFVLKKKKENDETPLVDYSPEDDE